MRQPNLTIQIENPTAIKDAHQAEAPRVNGLAIVSFLAVVKFVLHLATTGRFGYGFFVDELYFLACAEHLDWGYVDMPPLLPTLIAVVRAVLGDSLLAVRLFPAIAGSGLVLLTGLIARELGGGRFAQALAALTVVIAPIYLGLHSVQTMNAYEPLFWMGCAYVMIRIVKGGNPKLWLVFGLLAGLGMMNKHSMAFFGFGILAGLLLTNQRKLLFNRVPPRFHNFSKRSGTGWFWLGGLIAFIIFLPNLLWMIEHDFPHLQLLANIRAAGRNVELSPLEFILQQVLMMHPLAFPVWLAGLLHFFLNNDARPYRVLGIAYLTILFMMLVLEGRVYYLAPAYPMLLAGGGVAIEKWIANRGWAVVKPAYVTVLVLGGLILAPIALPCLPPEDFIRYAEATGLQQPRVETHRLGRLPQLHADRFGWEEMAKVVAQAYQKLPPEERAKTAIFGQNYGQAGAIDLFGPQLGLPKALSGHLTYHYWGPREYKGEIVIVMGDRREVLESKFDSVELVGVVEHPYSMPYQQFDVYRCRGLRQPLHELWPQLRQWD